MARSRSIGWLVYQAALMAALPLATPWLIARRGFAHYRATWQGRWATQLPPRPAGPRPLWLHGVSVGEVAVAATLSRQLPADLPMVITTITPTGQEHARKLFAARLAAGTAALTFLPFDLAPVLKRFFDHFQPTLLVLSEGDYWPRLLAECQARYLPVAVINGRLSDRAFRRQRHLGRLNRLFYAGIDRFGVQSAEDARRLASLGAEAERVHVTGNLKFDAPAVSPLESLEKCLIELAAGRALLVAGSTMEGEESALLAACAPLRDRLLLVLAPRHPERWDAVASVVGGSGASLLRRSSLGPNADGRPAIPRPDVVLLDSLGELAAVYHAATLTFVGGTLVPKGGHNPLEPARFAKPIVVGPSMFNFREMAEEFSAERAWLQVSDGKTLADALVGLLEQPEEAAALGQRALALLTRNRGAVARTLALLAPRLNQFWPGSVP